MKVLVAQIGARRHYAVPRGLQEAGVLAGLIADACADIWPWKALGYLPVACRRGVVRSILGRKVTGVPSCKIEGMFGFALAGVTFGKQGVEENRTDFWVRRNADFGRRVAAMDWGAADTVYAYNGAALEVFEEAKRRGLRCVLDQTAAPWRYNTELLQREQERWRGWEENPADMDLSGRMIEREEAEWELADRIVCGSDFVIDTLREVGGAWEKARTVHYPRPQVPSGGEIRKDREAGEKQRVLFVGTLQLRKGIQYLYEAAEYLDPEKYVIRAVGPSTLTPYAMRCLGERMEVRGAVPREEVWKYYGWADVFVLPTLSEGSANVCHEAMAVGLPVITTKASGVDREGGVLDVANGKLIASVVDERQGFPAMRGVSGLECGYGVRIAEAIEDVC